MAGTSTDFDSAAFRTAIQGVFAMGTAPLTDDQPLFYFPVVTVYSTDAVDGIGVPFSPTATATSTQADPISVPCGIEYKDGKASSTVFGEVVAASAIVTILDVDYAKIVGFEYVILHEQKFKLMNIEPVQGLFDVGILTLNLQAENSS